MTMFYKGLIFWSALAIVLGFFEVIPTNISAYLACGIFFGGLLGRVFIDWIVSKK